MIYLKRDSQVISLEKNYFDIIIIISESDNDKGLLEKYEEYSKRVHLFSNIISFYNWLKIEKISHDSKIAIIGSEEESLNYQNLLEFYTYYTNVVYNCKKGLETFNKLIIDDDNPIINDGIKEFVRMNNDGKFIRAFLIALGYHSVDDNNDDYLSLALAYETFQTAILIHDDIMDKALLRRGKHTIPVHYSNKYQHLDNDVKNDLANNLAICLGDFGFFYTTKIINEVYKDNKYLSQILALYSEIQIKTVKGQLLDLELPVINKYDNNKNTMDNVFKIYQNKTAWYSIIGPYLLGLSLHGKSNEKMIPILEKLGIAFQIKDDLLGIFGNEKELGKNISNDINEFKQTILYAYIKDQNDKYLPDLLLYYGKDVTFEEIKKVQIIMESSGAKDYAINRMQELFDESKELLDNMTDFSHKYKNILLGFILYLELRDK